MEVDITKKVQYLMKYGLVGLILIAVLCAGGIYYYQHQHKYFNVYDAQVTSSLVAAKVHGNAMITEKVVAEGEHVEAGDVIAHVQSTVTDEQIAILKVLSDTEPMQVDDLTELVDIPTRRVLSALTVLEIDQYVVQHAGKHYTRAVTLTE